MENFVKLFPFGMGILAIFVNRLFFKVITIKNPLGEGFVVGLIGFAFGWAILGLVFLFGRFFAKSGKSPLHDQVIQLLVSAYLEDQKKNIAEARAFYEKAFLLEPQYKDGILQYASFLNRIGAFDDTLRLIENLQGDDRYHRIRGFTLLGQKKTNDALPELLEANRINGSDTDILNALADCYLQLGRKDDARNALNASLKLDPKQHAVRKRLQEMDS